MEFRSVREILYFAMSKEQASSLFYEDLASQMSDSATKAIFEVLARQELKHAASLELEIIKQGYTVPLDGVEEPLNAADRRLQLDDNARNMNYIDALALAIEKERGAFQMYAQLVGTVQDPEFRKILLELAEEEMRHVIQFEREYEAVTHHKD